MKMFAKLLFFYVVLCSASGVTCLEIRTFPKYFQGKTAESEFHVSCTTSPVEPIAGCQFRVWYDGKKEGGQVFDISEKNDTVTIPNNFAYRSNFTAESVGTNFKTGDCGVNLTGLAGRNLLIGCKLTNRAGVSAVKTIPLYFPRDVNTVLNLENNTEVRHVSLGQDLRFSLKTKDGKSLSYCHVNLKDNFLKVWSTRDNTSVSSDERYQLSLERGECRFKITNFTESDNRTYFLEAENDSKKATAAKVVTLILKQDIAMVLEPTVDVYNVGDRVTATCNSRAVLENNLVWSWKLGSESQGQDKRIPRANWTWPWETTLTSDTRSFVLTKDHNDKDITCSLRTQQDGGVNLEAAERIRINQPKTTSTQELTTTNATTNATTNQSEPVGIEGRDLGDTDQGDLDFNSSTFFIGGLVLGVILTALIATAVTLWIRKRRVAANTVSYRSADKNSCHYEVINEGMFPYVAPAPAVPGRPSVMRARLLSVPRVSAPPCPEEPEYIIPDTPDDLDDDGYLQPLSKSSVGFSRKK